MDDEIRFPKIKEILKKIKNNYGDVMGTQEKEEKDYVLMVKEIVNSIENNNLLDISLYEKLIKKYPQIKEVIDDLIKQVEIYSVYDLDKSQINFDFSAYLEKIKEMI